MGAADTHPRPPRTQDCGDAPIRGSARAAENKRITPLGNSLIQQRYLDFGQNLLRHALEI
ncbi:hypothetical protein CA223_09005 [Sphingomonas koreensis]|uniref:Uncharacterized protein n=1 Tax=Sphingomonas koreensis TaxID=93064 RepID=A0AAJ4S8I6_9SPHN|nr:hypothetical protein BRX39_08695 [Sphingomonas koreensis]RSU41330.1 hypothetical protein CA223_09005 [Sphingomonas koreensis]RSU49866.1 hypothetical protein CA221_12315 [Sphingomonas koreensis]RSU63539.1 hypothetical protein DAH56_01350 [Sphingomonas koreensis]RSU83461.1 hypothetical protein CA253_21170 [Sphingomonas koreensis]